jgi:uncharacterized repeat protein (TIGR02543 family)
MTYLNFTKHAASNDGNLRAQAQQIGWRESLAQWFTGGLPSLLLTLLLSWGLIVPTQAATILSYAGPLSGSPVKSPPPYPDSDALDLASTDFTLLACINLAKYNEGYSGTIFSKRGTQNGWFFGVDGEQSSAANGTLKFKNETNGSVARSTQIIVLGRTHDVVLVYKSGTASMYIDGKFNSSYSISRPSGTDKPLVIGKENDDRIKVLGQPHWWNGTLSDLQIHNVALTEAEIKKHDAQCRGIPRLFVTLPSGGTVTGTVTGTTGKIIDCGTQCQADFANKSTTVTLRAIPKSGYLFTGWSGDCTGTALTCQLTMSQMKTVTATFKPSVLLTVNVQEGGTVTGPSINCSDPCSVQMVRVVQGSSITLTATPLDGFRFTGWSGDCTGTSCTVSMTQIKAVTANFVPLNRSAVRSNSCGTPCQVDVAKDTKATYDPATGVLHLPAIEVLGQAAEIEVFQADLVWKTDNSKSWFELVSRQNSTALAGTPENAIYDLETNTLKVPVMAVQGGDGTKFYSGELQLISADPQRFMVTQVREIEGSLIDSLPLNR